MLSTVMKTTHEIDQEAQLIFRSLLPSSWFFREQRPDWYIDYFVETANSGKPTGLDFAVQLKGSLSLDYSKSHVKHRLETKHLRYYIDNVRRPVFLVVIDINDKTAYWLFTQQHIKEQLESKNWRSQQKITLYIPKENQLYSLAEFESEVARAELYMRNLWPSSIDAAISHEKHVLEKLDSRAKVELSIINGAKVYSLQPKENTEFTFHLHVKNTPQNRLLMMELIERGKDIELSFEDFTISGSNLFQKFFESLKDIKLHIGTHPKASNVQLVLWTINEEGNEISTIHNLMGDIRTGTKEAVYDGYLANSPLKARLLFSRIGIAPGIPLTFDINFNLSQWYGKPLLQLSYFDQIYAFFSNIKKGHRLAIKLEYEGNFLLSGSSDNEPTNPLFTDIYKLMYLIHKARTIAEYIGVNPLLPKANTLLADEQLETIELLYDIIVHGEHKCHLGSGATIDMTMVPNTHMIEMLNSNEKVVGDIMLLPDNSTYDFLGQPVNIGTISLIVTHAKLLTRMRDFDSHILEEAGNEINIKWELGSDSEIIRKLDEPSSCPEE